MKNLPKRIFLDTCAVNFILDYGNQIHENCEIPGDLSFRITRDVNAFQEIWRTGQRAFWKIIISEYTVTELSKTQDSNRKKRLLDLANEIIAYQESESGFTASPVTTKKLLLILPDFSDRILIHEAIKSNCDVFCTRDWKTILRFRNEIGLLPIKIMAPHEWWEIIKPFSSLWC